MHNFEKTFLWTTTKSSEENDSFSKNSRIFGDCSHFVTIVKTRILHSLKKVFEDKRDIFV